jgi:hypothetical protein
VNESFNIEQRLGITPAAVGAFPVTVDAVFVQFLVDVKHLLLGISFFDFENRMLHELFQSLPELELNILLEYFEIFISVEMRDSNDFEISTECSTTVERTQ